LAKLPEISSNLQNLVDQLQSQLPLSYVHISTKTQIYQATIKIWNKEKFGNILQEKKKLTQKMEKLQQVNNK
jgi:hypothetical protein